jgi:hypothetical protein
MIDSLPSDLTDEQRVKAITVLKTNADVFSKTSTDIGLTDVLTHTHSIASEPVDQLLCKAASEKC